MVALLRVLFALLLSILRNLQGRTSALESSLKFTVAFLGVPICSKAIA